MIDQKIAINKSGFSPKVDTKEFELPDTNFVSDIDTKVFQGIVLECLSQIDDIALVEGSLIDSILGRTGPEISGIHSERDSSTHSVSIKIEVNVCYGVSIPQKAEEIQNKVVEAITNYTGLHVSSIHVVFRGIIPSNQSKAMMHQYEQLTRGVKASDYNDDF